MSVTSEDHHVEAVIDLLQAASGAEWTPTTPEVQRYWDVAQSEKGPGAGQPGQLYVWSPTGSTLDQFSMDGTQFDQTDAVEVQIWTLDATECEQLQSDVTRILSKFIDDNETATPYSTVRSTTENDFREQKPARQTDHYIMSVEIEPRGLSETREVDSTAFESAFDSPFA